MSNPWDKPATKYRSSKVTLITADWHSIPWVDLYNSCKDAQYSAIETAKAENLQRYTAWIQKKEQEELALTPEVGSFEGNLSDEFPFVELSKQKLFRIGRLASNAVIEDFIVEHKLKDIAVTLLNQITKHLSTFKLSTVSGQDYNKNNPDDLISADALYRQVFRGNEKMLGVYEFLMLDSRSAYLDKQYAAPSKSYCALVPIIMSAFKVHHGVPYSHWAPEELIGVVNTKLLDAMMFEDYDFSSEDILAARAEGLMQKTGLKAGTPRNPVYTFKLWGKTSLSGLPEYTQVMLTQIWCAHPQNRTKYMILDPKNWDSIPNALISTEIQTTHTPAYVSKLMGEDFPWLQK